MSKRGHVYYFMLFMNAALNIVKNTATFKAYYDAKKAENRLHCNALGHCANKLVKDNFKMLADKVEFNLK